MASSISRPDFANHTISSVIDASATWSLASTIGGMPLFLGILIAYVSLCSSLRHRRLAKMRQRFGLNDRASLSRMTNSQAQEIMKTVLFYEFPAMYEMGLLFSLFRTYASKRVGGNLVTYSDLAKPGQVAKRFEDTDVLYTCFVQFPPTSELYHKAVARVNYLHAPYIKSGAISQADLLFVLWTGMDGPIEFINRHEWRQLSDLEVAAHGTFWKYVGEGMGIDYLGLLGKNQWKDGIEFCEDVARWNEGYERENTQLTKGVDELGAVLVEMKLRSYPKFLRPLAYQAALVLMGPQLRKMFSFPDPSPLAESLTPRLLRLRAMVIKYLALPRVFAHFKLSDADPETKRIKNYHYVQEPWYNPPTWMSRWGPTGILTWLDGGLRPGDGNGEMKPGGFLFEDLGPRRKMGMGAEENEKEALEIGQRTAGTCPFAIKA